MGSISGLKSILLLVDLCTCRISDQNQNLKWFTLGEFLVYKVQVYTSIMVLLPGIKQQSFGNCVKNWCVCHLVSINKFYGIVSGD